MEEGKDTNETVLQSLKYNLYESHYIVKRDWKSVIDWYPKT